MKFKKYLKETHLSIDEYKKMIDLWINKGAKDYAKTLIKVYGKPDAGSERNMIWYNRDGFSTVEVKDENVEHAFPKLHYDFVYSSRKINVPSNLYNDFAEVTGSIIIDGLKQIVTARCGTVSANAVTLGFVEDVIRDKAKAVPKEYAKRINNMIVPEWYQNLTKEL